jgi:hypothetical protein
MNIYVTDLREKLRRSPLNRQPTAFNINERRKVRDRRVLPSEANTARGNAQRIWLTKGERALIEDLYLLDDI